MTIINTDTLNLQREKVARDINPNSFTSAREYYNAIEQAMWEFEKECWKRVTRRQDQIQSMVVHILVSPPISTDLNEVVYGSEVTIKANDFKAFCSAYSLPHDKMLQLSEGKIREVKGWTRSTKLSTMIYGSPYSPPKVSLTEGQKRKRDQEIAADKARMASLKYKTPIQAKPFTFSPDSPQPLPTKQTLNIFLSTLINR